MSFYKPIICKECGKKTYPLNCWQNWLKVDWLMIMIAISIILMIFGFKQTLAECKQMLTDPCLKLASVCCLKANIQTQPTTLAYTSINLNNTS
jgi:hypothetical protein